MTARFASGRIPCIWATLMLSELVACGSKSPETTSSPDGGGSKEEKDGGTKTSSDATHADASHADASLTDATSTEAAAPVVGTHVASCDETVVQDAINNAKSGDTLLVPAGQCTWTTGVTLPNSTGAAVPDSFAISLKGAGASSSGTVITYGGTGVTLLNVNPPYMYNIKYPATLGHYDISGFYMTGGDPAYYSGNHMAISGPTGWKNVRVHDMLFEGGTQASIVATASVAGLVDHCTFQGDMGAFKFYGQGEADWTTPLVLGTADQWEAHQVLFTGVGPNYWKGETGRKALIAGKAKFTDPQFLAAWEYEAKLGKYLAKGASAQTYGDSQNMFALGQGAVYAAGSWDIAYFNANGSSKLELGVFPPPVPKAGDACYISDHNDIGMGVNKKSKNKEDAYKFLAWLGSQEFADVYTNKVTGFFSLSNHLISVKDPIAKQMIDWRKSCSSTIRVNSQILNRGTPSMENEMWNVNVQVLNGKMTPLEAATKIQTGFAKWYKPQQ